MNTVKKNIRDLKPYIPGKLIEETKRQFSLKQVFKLASNENPLGCSPLVLRVLKKSLVGINRYPDGSCFLLKKALSKNYKIKPSCILLGNGSDELIDIVIKTFVKSNENVISSDTTFLEYEIISKVNGVKFIKVPLNGFKYDLDAIKNKINSKTRVIFIANPNNPTGTYVNSREVALFLKSIPKGIIVVFDEAYIEYVDKKDFPDLLKGFKSNLIILRTFSKVYGLAGLRLGYAIADKALIDYMNRARQPFNVNQIAQVAGVAALKDKTFIKKTKALVLKQKKFLYVQFDKLEINYIPSVGNFILFKVNMDGLVFVRRMLKKGIIVRDMKQYGLDDYVRVTIGKEKENKIFLKELKKIVKEEK
ncbi:MAG: histidinol-phosphate transaminase [Candidatus Gygaella obscura]|nr:histidinol-phosphate transaminase [Candidatus Gygaella obscura]